jgi:hypothetical protein
VNGLLWKYLGVNESGAPRTTFLDDLLFRFTPPHSLNDISELKPCILMEAFSEDDRRVARERAAQEHGPEPMDDELAESLFLGITPRARYDEKEFPGLWPMRAPELRPEPFRTIAEYDAFMAERVRQRVQTTLNAHIAVFSLSTDPAGFELWTHYAAGQRGIAVGLDPAVFRRIPGIIALRDVEYSDTRVAISSNDGFIRIAGESFKESGPWPLRTLLRKSTKCHWEKEVRLLAPLNGAFRVAAATATGEAVQLFRIPSEAVRCVILGDRVSAGDEATITAQLRANKKWSTVALKRARLSSSGYDIETHDILWND